MLATRQTNSVRRRPSVVLEQQSLNSQRRHKPDYLLLVLAAMLLAIGLVVLYSISPGLAAVKDVSDNYFVTKQLTAIGLGIVALSVTALLPLKIWPKISTYLLALAGLASIVVLFMPVDEIYRAHRWIFVGGFSFQVAELIKFAVLIAVAQFLAVKWQQNQINSFKLTLRPLLVLIALSGVVVAGLQSDLGSTAVIVAMIMAMAFLAGVPMKKLSLISAVMLAGLTIFVFTSDYRISRLETYLNPGADCSAAGYQACQALIAVGSGGLIGQGLGQGVQAYGYLPEAANDSIFAVMAEKFGFLGISLVLAIYVVLFSRLKKIIETTSNPFNKLVVIGVLAWISTQAIINIGAMVGLLPLKGITLPFISYGGTSLIFLTAALGIVFNISRYTNYHARTTQQSAPKRPASSQTNRYNDRSRVGRPHNPDNFSGRRAEKS